MTFNLKKYIKYDYFMIDLRNLKMEMKKKRLQMRYQDRPKENKFLLFIIYDVSLITTRADSRLKNIP